MMASMGWPRTTGLLRKREVVSSIIADGTAKQLGDIGQSVGAEQPDLGARLIAAAFTARDWNAYPVRELAADLDAAHRRGWSSLASVDENAPWDVLTSPQMQTGIVFSFAASLWHGLTQPSEVRRILGDAVQRTVERAPEAVEHGLDIDPDLVPGSVSAIAQHGSEMVETYEAEFWSLPDAPPALLDAINPLRSSDTSA